MQFFTAFSIIILDHECKAGIRPNNLYISASKNSFIHTNLNFYAYKFKKLQRNLKFYFKINILIFIF